jgi:hypothetical protein
MVTPIGCLAAMLFVFSPSPVLAQGSPEACDGRWCRLYSDERAVAFVDAQSLTIDSRGAVIAWVREDWNSPQRWGSQVYWKVLRRVSFDCIRRTQHVLEASLHDAEGNLIDSSAVSVPEEPLHPGTIGELVGELVCAVARGTDSESGIREMDRS